MDQEQVHPLELQLGKALLRRAFELTRGEVR